MAMPVVSAQELLENENEHLRAIVYKQGADLKEIVCNYSEVLCADVDADKGILNLLALSREQIKQHERTIDRLRAENAQQAKMIAELGLPKKKKQKK
jgi:hypothetical protein